MAEKKPGTKHAYMALASMCVSVFGVSGASFGGLSLFTDPVSQSLGILRTEFALIITFATLFHALVAMTIYGPIWKKIGTRGCLILGSVLLVLSYVCYCVCQEKFVLWAGGIIQGVACGFLCNATINTVVVKWFAQKQGLIFSIIRLVGNFSGTLFSTIIAFMLINPALGWRRTFIVLTVAIALCAIIWILLYKGDPDDLNEYPAYYEPGVDGNDADEIEYGYTASETKRMSRYWIMVAGWFFCGFAVNGTLSILSPICNDMGYATLGGTALSVLWLAAALGGIVVGITCDKWNTKPSIIVTGLMVTAGSLLLMPSLVPVPVVYLAAILLGVGYTSQIIPLGITIKEAFGNREFGDKNPIVGGMMVVGMSLAPVVLNAFYDFGGGTYTYALLLNGLVSIISVALIVMADKIIKPGDAEADHREASQATAA